MNVEQAAILCGGLGSRLRPITDTLPKPMVLINGRPFLEYLIEQVRDQGISKILLMTGYLGEQIQEYFGDGKKWNVDIQYSYGPVEWDTGRRLYEAQPKLEDRFMIMYSDNYVQVNLKNLITFHEESGKCLSFIVQKKENANIRLRIDGTVEAYDKTRSTENLKYVELGFMVTDKRIFKYYQKVDVSFSDILFKLVSSRQIGGMIVKDAYYSISDPERLEYTREYLKPKKIILIDRDGTINQKAPRGEYITKWSDFHFIPETIKGMKGLARSGFKFVILSNQAGIARGVVSHETVQNINRLMKLELEDEGISVLDILICPHHWEDNCDCRKPSPGMFYQTSQKWKFRLDKTFYIGDDPRDCQAANNAGCKSIYVGEQMEVQHLAKEEKPLLIVSNFMQCVSFLKNHDYFKNTVSN
jgi:histidinol-phosphate phosphatase family protein